MPYRRAESDDPMLLVGVELDTGPESVVDMAYTFAEELAQMGYDERGILGIFENPTYRGPRGAYEQLGAGAVGRIGSECVAVFGRFRVAVQEPQRLVQLRRVKR